MRILLSLYHVLLLYVKLAVVMLTLTPLNALFTYVSHHTPFQFLHIVFKNPSVHVNPPECEVVPLGDFTCIFLMNDDVKLF